MRTIRRGIVVFGLWLARLGGAAVHVPDDAVMAHVCAVVKDIDQRTPEAPSEIKRRNALLVLLNTTPGKERYLNLLIELALQ